jgi:uncharacterized protein YndB with AHSA1/START domain
MAEREYQVYDNWRNSWFMALNRSILIKALLLLMACAISGAAQDRTMQEVEDEIDAPVKEVWKAFTTKEGIESWMVPVAEIDFRVGGEMRTNYNKDGKIGDSGTIINAILSYDPERMLSIRATGSPANFPYKKALEKSWTVIYFEPLPGNRTKVRVVGLGYEEDAESQMMREFFKKGNAITLEHLKKRFAKPTTQ